MSETLCEAMKDRIEDLVDSFVVEGAEPADVLDAIAAEVTVLRQAFARDPAPADDPVVVEEPSNDWPADDGKSHAGDA